MKRTTMNSRKRRAQSGTSTIEAVIVLPVMLLLVFSIAELGIAFTRSNSLTNAVREGARAGVVFRAPCSGALVRAQVKTTVSTFASSSGIDPATIITGVTGECAGTGTQLIVDATVPYNFVALDSLAGLAPSLNLTARTVMRNE